MNKFRREGGMFLALAILCLGLFVSNHDFLGQSNVINTTRQIAMLATFGIGMAFVIITGGIDLSVGSIIGLTGVLIAKITSDDPECYGKPLWMAIAIALGVALLIGLIQGLLITRLDLQPFIVTLGGMLLLRGVSQTIVKGGTLGFGDSNFPDMAQSGLCTLIGGDDWASNLPHWLSGHGLPTLLNWIDLLQTPVLICIFTAIVGAYFLHFTVFGRYVYAIGGNRDAARYSGVNVKRVETLTYVISAGLAGIAGVSYAAYNVQQSQQNGISYELYAIAGAVLGGCSLRGGEGTVFGVFVGSAIMRVIDNGINMFQFKHQTPDGTRIWRLDPNWNFIIIGAVILIAVIMDQVAHAIQASRRTRKVADLPAPPPKPPGGLQGIAAGSP